MIFFVIAITIYAGMLILIRPAPESLRDRALTYVENLRKIPGSLISGMGLLTIYFLISRLTFLVPDPDLLQILSLNNDPASTHCWLLQAFTHLFVHANVLHLGANVAGIGMLSVYERRVGTRRFFAVLCVGNLASIPSILMYSDPTFVCGISGGVFALAAAFATDEPNLNFKEWLLAILFFCMFTLLLSLDNIIGDRRQMLMQIDHIGHALGATAGILYCRLRPLSSKQHP